MVNQKIKVLITGANGFIGKNLVTFLLQQGYHHIIKCDRSHGDAQLEAFIQEAEVIIHLAGINRPQDDIEFERGNVAFTQKLLDMLVRLKRKTPIIFSSSVQAGMDNPYGQSKRRAEALLEAYSTKTNAKVSIYRLKNVFGKWCKPNYNSVVATFCHQITHHLPIAVSDPLAQVTLVYIDDVLKAFVDDIEMPSTIGVSYKEVVPSYTINLGRLVDILESFKNSRTTLLAADFGDDLTRKLYATYLAYLDPGQLSYALDKKFDERGYLGEFIKAAGFGQIFVSTTLPGVTRGNHYHNTRTEKFFVVQGEAVIALRQILSTDIVEHKVNGAQMRVVDIPPGYTHFIKNIGPGNLVTLFWSNQIFDPNHSDTYPMNVLLDDIKKEGS